MAKKLLPDALWSKIAPLFRPEAVPPKGGRPPIGWERLPFEVAAAPG